MGIGKKKQQAIAKEQAIGSNPDMAKRKFRIVKRENNFPVLGVCEYCHAAFAADPETIGRPKDAHADIQKQFILHSCKPPGEAQPKQKQ